MAAVEAPGGFSRPVKMPCAAWSIPATECRVGSRLREVAGSTCASCYARKGMYVMPHVRAAMGRRWDTLQLALRDHVAADTWVAEFVAALTRRLELRERRGRPGRDDGRYFRWHDSGDLQSVGHLRLVVRVCEATPDVAHWLPTREVGIVRNFLRAGGVIPPNLAVRLSVARVGAEVPNGWAELIAHPRVTASGVIPRNGGSVVGMDSCAAPTQDGECRACRACWDPTKAVAYHAH